MKSWAFAAFAASMTSPMVASGFAYRMLSAIVPRKRNISCETMAMPFLSDSDESSLTLTPSMRTEPEMTS